LEEEAFGHVDEEKISNNDYNQENKIKRGQSDKTERSRQGAEWQRNTNADNTKRGNDEPFAWFAFIERLFDSPNNKDYQDLGGKGFYKPSCLEKFFLRVKNKKQHTECQIIKD